MLVVKNLPVNAGNIGDAVQSLGWEDPPEKEIEPRPVFLTGRFHGQEETMGSQSRTRLKQLSISTREEVKGTMKLGL